MHGLECGRMTGNLVGTCLLRRLADLLDFFRRKFDVECSQIFLQTLERKLRKHVKIDKGSCINEPWDWWSRGWGRLYRLEQEAKRALLEPVWRYVSSQFL
jgi:hypothetical protein